MFHYCEQILIVGQNLHHPACWTRISYRTRGSALIPTRTRAIFGSNSPKPYRIRAACRKAKARRRKPATPKTIAGRLSPRNGPNAMGASVKTAFPFITPETELRRCWFGRGRLSPVGRVRLRRFGLCGFPRCGGRCALRWPGRPRLHRFRCRWRRLSRR